MSPIIWILTPTQNLLINGFNNEFIKTVLEIFNFLSYISTENYFICLHKFYFITFLLLFSTDGFNKEEVFEFGMKNKSFIDFDVNSGDIFSSKISTTDDR